MGISIFLGCFFYLKLMVLRVNLTKMRVLVYGSFDIFCLVPEKMLRRENKLRDVPCY